MNKHQKAAAVILSAGMLLSALPPAYAANALILSQPEYTLTKDGIVSPIQNPEPGFVTTSVEISNPSESDENACLLVCVSDSATGKLLSVDIDEKTIPANQKIKLEKGINVAAGQTHTYYVWDNIQNHTPLKNTAPTAPGNLSADIKTNSAIISWDESLDDKGVTKYVIMQNGEEVSTTDQTTFSLSGLERGEPFKYEIAARDAEGALSAGIIAEGTAKTMEECTLRDNSNDNISFIVNTTNIYSDNYNEEYNIGGRDCYINTKQPRGDGGYRIGYFYFPVNSDYIGIDTKSVALEVTFFDDSTQTIGLAYNTGMKTSENTTLEPGMGTNTWKTQHIVLNDAGFTNTLNDASFRLMSNPGTKLHKVAICPGEDFSPAAPNVKFGDNTTDTYDMNFYPNDAQSAYGITYSSVDNTPCMYAPNGGKFEFDIKDSLTGRNGGYIEVTYYDDGNDSLILNYDNYANLTGKVAFENTKTFKTVRIPLDAAKLAGGISGAGGKKFDFTLSTEKSSPLALTSVKYVAGDSDYVIPPQPKDFSNNIAVCSEDYIEGYNDTVPVNKNIAFVMNRDNNQNDAYSESAVIDGRECRKSTSQPRNDGNGSRLGMFHFKVNPNYITPSTNDVWIEYTYWDEGTSEMQLQYNSIEKPVAKGISLGKRTDTKTWKTDFVHLTDANFTNNKGITYSSFRFNFGANSYFYSAAVFTAEDYNEYINQ